MRPLGKLSSIWQIFKVDLYLCISALRVRSSVVDQDHFDTDPDPAFHLDTDPDPVLQFDRIRIRLFETDPDPYRFKEYR